MSAPAADHLFPKPLRRLLWILGGLVIFGQFSLLMLRDLAVIGDPNTGISSGWVTLVHSALTHPADIKSFTSRPVVGIALASLVTAALGSLAIFAVAAMRRERLAWSFVLLCFGTSLYGSLRILASTVHDPEQFNYMPPKVIWLADGGTEYLLGLVIPGLFYVICIPVLLIRWMAMEWDQGRGRPPCPLAAARTRPPSAAPGAPSPSAARLSRCLWTLRNGSGGKISLEGVPWPEGGRTSLVFSMLALPRDWHFSWADNIASSLGWAMVPAALASLGLVVLATRGRQRLAPAVTAICAIWSAITVNDTATRIDNAPRAHEWPHPYGALELWLGIFLPSFVYALLLIALLIPLPLQSLVRWSSARLRSRPSTIGGQRVGGVRQDRRD
jgi:hypothetical protein